MLITTEIFKQQMLEKQPSIEVLSEYCGDKGKVLVKCKICGHQWEDSASHLKQGRSCSKCKKIAKQKQYGLLFIEKASIIHHNKYDYSKVEYVSAKTKVKIVCPEHGEFEQTPNSHLKGRGCPKCAGNNFLKTKEQFISDAIKIHGDKYDYSQVEYKGANIPVLIKCKTCGTIFKQSPDKHINAIHGCPNCNLKSQTNLYYKLHEQFPDIDILFEVNKNIVPWLGKQRFDIYIPKFNIAIEYNGIQHYIPIEHFGGILEFQNIQERDKLKRQKCLENNCTLFEIKYDYTDADFQTLCDDIQSVMNNTDKQN